MKGSRVKVDLLAPKPLRALALWPGFPLVLQVLGLVVLGLLVAVGLGIGVGMSPAELMTLRKTNLATLVVWGIWWPAMIITAVAFGHAWCTVCPMELLNHAGEVIGRKLRLQRLPLGRTLRAGWAIVGLYLVLQLLVAGFSLHRTPHYTAIFLLMLGGLALSSGILFREPRAFCRALCPASALLSVYGRFTPAQLEVRKPSVCEACATKDCVRASNRTRLDKRSCPSLLRPFHREVSDGCVLCLQCAKVCPHDNVGFGLVSESAPVRRKTLLRPFEAAFVMVALGFVSHEVIGEVKWLDGIFHAVPSAMAKAIPAVSFDWHEALWFLLVYPAGVWALIAAVAYLAGHRGGLRSVALAAATGAAPVVAIAHVAKALAKLSSWGGFLPLAVRDPAGIDTLHAIAAEAVAAPHSYVAMTMLGWAMLFLTVLIACKAWRWAREIPTESIAAAKAGLATTAVLFSAVLTIWGWPAK